MENSQLPLATDSFSHSWLINRKPSFDGLVESLRPSLDYSSETVPMVHHLNKILKDDHHHDFDFNIPPGSRPSIALVDADEIFSEGCIKPLFPNLERTYKMQASTSLPATPISSVSSSRTAVSISLAHHQAQYFSRRKWTKPSNKVLQKCLTLLRPFCRGFVCSRKSIRVDDIDRKVLEVGSNSQHASPPPSSPHHHTHDARLCDIESSIYEAILHCKRSFGN